MNAYHKETGTPQGLTAWHNLGSCGSLFERLLLFQDSAGHDAAWNMAVDEALVRSMHVPLLRIYGWSRPALSFGCFQPYAEIEPLSAGREVVRRWTGGGTVLHGEDFTYSLIFPRNSKLGRMSAADSYCAIHRTMTAGFGASLATAGDAGLGGACFTKPVTADVMRDGKKIAGAAQRRTRDAVLHQGSIQGVSVPMDFGLWFAESLEPFELPEPLVEQARALVETRYGTSAWTFRF